MEQMYRQYLDAIRGVTAIAGPSYPELNNRAAWLTVRICEPGFNRSRSRAEVAR